LLRTKLFTHWHTFSSKLYSILHQNVLISIPHPRLNTPGTTDNSAPVSARNATKTTLKLTSSHWRKRWLSLLHHSYWCAKNSMICRVKQDVRGRGRKSVDISCYILCVGLFDKLVNIHFLSMTVLAVLVNY